VKQTATQDSVIQNSCRTICTQQITAKCVRERIVKIGEHLAQLEAKI